MKKYKILGVGVLAMLFSSCSLDTTPTNQVSSDQAIGTVMSMQMAMEGLYLDISVKGEHTGSRPSIVSRGLQNCNSIINDIMGGIFVLDDSDFRIYEDYTFGMNVQGSRLSDRTLIFWSFNYAIIRRVNEILYPALAKLEGAAEADAKVLNQMIGELYGIRALIYHTLNIKYAFRYTEATAATTLSVPIVLTVNTSDMGNIVPRNTQAEVVSRIKTDMTEAFKHFELGSGVENVYTVNKTAVKVLKARLEMYTENYSDALATAQDIIATSGKSIMNTTQYEGGFNDATNPEWIFASNQSGDYTITWASFMNSMAVNYPTSYGPISIDLSYIFGIDGNNDLMPGEEPYLGGLPKTIGLTIRPTDSRLNLFVTADDEQIAANIASNPDYYIDYKDRGVEPGAQKKYYQVGSGGAADVISMRLAEVYYIAAESAAYLNQDAIAQTYLLATVTPYDPTLTKITQTGKNLKTLIANYKAVDMFGEGRSFEDIKRRGEWVYRIQKYNESASYTATRQYKSTPPYVTRDVPFADVLTYPIPKKAKDANPLLENNF